MAPPNPVPQFAGPESVLLAAGILGATVMPHAIFLHSSLTQDRIVVRDPALGGLVGRYLYGDHCNTTVRVATLAQPTASADGPVAGLTSPLGSPCK